MIVPSEENERRAERWSHDLMRAWDLFEFLWIAVVFLGLIAFVVGRAIYLAVH